MYTTVVEKNEEIELTTRLSKNMYDALVSTYQAKIKYAKANLEVYFNKPVGIGEHSDILAEIDVHLATIAEADGKLFALENNFTKIEKKSSSPTDLVNAVPLNS